MFREILQEYLKINDITQKELAALIGDSQQAVSDFLSKTSNPRKTTKEKYFKKLVGFEDYYNKKTSKKDFKPEGKIINEEELPKKQVTVIPIKGRGGLENAYYDRLYIKGLEKETLTIKVPSSNGSEWFKIEVEGVSMDDSTTDFEGSKHSLAEGDWAYVRSVPKIYWKDKLHFNKVKVFCFFHNTRGIIFKKVIDHNKETGEVILHSLNKDKTQFPDFTINIAECSYICNVVKVLSEF